MEPDKQQTKGRGKWILVNIDKLPVRPEVAQAREKWQGKEIWFRMKSGTWRRGKVERIDNGGAVLGVIYEKGTPGVPFAIELEHIPLLLKLVV